MPTHLKSVLTGMCLLLAAAVTTGWQAPPAGRLVFIGTYTGEKTGSKGIYAFRFDDASGALAPLGLKAETASPSFLTTNASGSVLYAVNEVGNFGGAKAGSVSSFSVDRASGGLTPLGQPVFERAAPLPICSATPPARCSRWRTSAAATSPCFRSAPTAASGEPTVLAGKAAGHTASRLDPMATRRSSNNQSIASCWRSYLGIDQVLVYRLNAATAVAERCGVRRAAPRRRPAPPGVPSIGTFRVHDQRLDSTIGTFSWTAATGVLAPIERGVHLPEELPPPTAAPRRLPCTRTAGSCYGSNRGHDSIAVFTAGGDGRLTLVEHEPTRGQTPRHFTLDPSGRWLIAANQNSNSLAVFRVDQSTGALTPSGALAQVGGPVCVLFMP